MKLFGGLIGIILVAIIGGFIYLSISDVHIDQQTVTKPISIQEN